MNDNLKQLFQKIEELNPPAELAGFIFAKIEKAKIARAERQLIFSYLGFVISFFLAIGVGVIFGQSFLQSEFWTISFLLFSDIAVVLKNWDTFFLSLLETFPVVHAAIFLVPVLLLLFSADCYFFNRANCKYKFISPLKYE